MGLAWTKFLEIRYSPEISHTWRMLFFSISHTWRILEFIETFVTLAVSSLKKQQSVRAV